MTPVTPDRFPGSREEDELVLEEQSTDPTEVGAIRNVSGALKAKDSVGVFDLRSGSGLSAAQHLVLDQLVHDVDENYYEEYTRSAGKVTNITVWTDSGKTIKIREYQYTYSGNKIDTETIIQYDGGGSEVERMTLTYTFTGNLLTSVSCVRTTP